MKKGIVFLALIWTVILSWCGNSGNVVEYNDSFVAIVKECTDSTQELFNVFNADWSTIDSIVESLESSINICKNSESKASKMWDFDKDSSLKDAVVDLLSTEVLYLEKFWATKRYRNTETVTNEDKEAYNVVRSDLSLTEEDLNAKFVSLQSVQEQFASTHGLKLSEY